ncbi:hypothetical protein [Phenylobacterium sp.]|uniref:hypothetical protein n=1 Tax=Phenylobacterium sp. TaxID=1871053 RepID=UPI002C9E61B6|nr:hypothetical protein [Phenylobacterium sp.]HLZ77111.1 hypothetical protein [Phenylobacterium sp.]
MTLAAKNDRAGAAADAYAIALAQINPAKAARFQDDTIWPYFERLRRDCPFPTWSSRADEAVA